MNLNKKEFLPLLCVFFLFINMPFFKHSLAWKCWLFMSAVRKKLHLKTGGRNLDPSRCADAGGVGRAACQLIWERLREAGTTQMERTSSIKPLTADKSFCSVQSLCCSGLISPLVNRRTWNSAAILKPFTVTSCFVIHLQWYKTERSWNQRMFAIYPW